MEGVVFNVTINERFYGGQVDVFSHALGPSDTTFGQFCSLFLEDLTAD